MEVVLGEAREIVAWSQQTLRQALTSARARPAAAALIAGTLALCAFAYVPVVRWLVDVWSSNPYYGHALLLLPVVLFVAWRRRDRLARTPRRVRDVDVIWLAPAAVLFILGRGLGSNHLQAWSLAPLVLGLVLLTQGRRRVRVLAWPLAMMVLVLPVPFQEWFFGPLQRLATIGAVGGVSAMGLPVTWSSTTLTVAGNTFQVVPLCAGLSSTLSLFAIAAVGMLVWPTKPVPQVGVFALVVPIALASNALRIASTAGLAAWRGPDLALAFFHSAGAVLLYAVGLGGIGAAIWAARRWGGIPEASRDPQPTGTAGGLGGELRG